MGFKVDSQFEAFGKERLHHHAYLVFAGIGHGRFGFDGKQIGSGPLGQSGEDGLTLSAGGKELVSERKLHRASLPTQPNIGPLCTILDILV